jgi:hypothetical protein
VSGDNFFLIRRAGSRYAVSSESASEATRREDPVWLARSVALFFTPTPIDAPQLVWFDDEDAAVAYAKGGDLECDVRVDTHSDSSHDTQSSRVDPLMHGIASIVPPEGVVRSNHPDNNAVTLHIGEYQVRVDGPTFLDASALASAIDAVCFPDLGE